MERDKATFREALSMFVMEFITLSLLLLFFITFLIIKYLWKYYFSGVTTDVFGLIKYISAVFGMSIPPILILRAIVSMINRKWV